MPTKKKTQPTHKVYYYYYVVCKQNPNYIYIFSKAFKSWVNPCVLERLLLLHGERNKRPISSMSGGKCPPKHRRTNIPFLQLFEPKICRHGSAAKDAPVQNIGLYS
jgi:hypothetical protein